MSIVVVWVQGDLTEYILLLSVQSERTINIQVIVLDPPETIHPRLHGGVLGVVVWASFAPNVNVRIVKRLGEILK